MDKLAPLSHLIIFISALAIALSSSVLPGFVISLLLSLFLVKLAGQSLRSAMRSFAMLWPLIFTVVLMNALFASSGTILFQFWIFSFSISGLMNGFRITLKLFYVTLLSEYLTGMLSESSLRDAIGTVIYPLGFLKVPTGDIAMIISLSLRFIPILKEECSNIIYAERARGAYSKSRGIIKKSRELFPLVIPLFIAVFRRADEMALSMEAKGWKSGERIEWHSPHFTALDHALNIMAISLMALCIYFRIKGVF